MNFFDFIERALPHPGVINFNEPLIAGAEDDGVVTAPAMRIRVVQPRGRSRQSTTFFQESNDGFVRVKNFLSIVFRQAFGKLTRLSHRTINFEPVFLPRLKVFAAVARRSVHRARPIFRRHILRQYSWNFSVKEGVLQLNPFQLFPGNSSQDLRRSQVRFRKRGLEAATLRQVSFTIPFAIRRHHIFEIGMKGYGHACRKRPGRGGPDDYGNLAARESRIKFCRVGNQRVFHIDRPAAVVRIFHFRLRQRSLV